MFVLICDDNETIVCRKFPSCDSTAVYDWNRFICALPRVHSSRANTMRARDTETGETPVNIDRLTKLKFNGICCLPIISGAFVINCGRFPRYAASDIDPLPYFSSPDMIDRGRSLMITNARIYRGIACYVAQVCAVTLRATFTLYIHTFPTSKVRLNL